MGESFSLTDAQRIAANRAADRARSFVEGAGYPLGVAMIDHAWNDRSAVHVVKALGAFQNDDGGFGRGLEVDIGSPASNPFAARLAMTILLGLNDPDETAKPMTASLQSWLIANQAEDGDWHFSGETKAGCVAALANRVGIATPDMLERVARLFSDMASLDAARTGDFYTLLPYTEYAGGIEWDKREAYLEAIAEGVRSGVDTGAYADAGHFWEHVLGGGPDLAARLPAEMLSQQADRLLVEQDADGGWPNPYNDAWRPYFTSQSCVALARLRDGI